MPSRLGINYKERSRNVNTVSSPRECLRSEPKRSGQDASSASPRIIRKRKRRASGSRMKFGALEPVTVMRTCCRSRSLREPSASRCDGSSMNSSDKG